MNKTRNQYLTHTQALAYALEVMTEMYGGDDWDAITTADIASWIDTAEQTHRSIHTQVEALINVQSFDPRELTT